MANIPRVHLPNPRTVTPGTQIVIPKPPGSVATPAVPDTTIPSIGQATTRDVTLEITDTQEGYIAPICYGRVRFAPKLVHFDIVNLNIELIALVGEGEIDGVEAVYIDDTECYATTQGWATVEVRTGTLTQTAVSCISNSTVSAMTHPGMAYVAARISLLSAPLNGGIPHVEVALRGLKTFDIYGTFGTDYPVAWSENPVSHVVDILRDADYGCGLAAADVDQWGSDYGSAFFHAATVDTLIDDTSLSWIGQAASNVNVGAGDYARLQSFKAPFRSVKITAQIELVASGSGSWPFELRATPDGAAIAYAMCTLGGVVPPGVYTVVGYYGADLKTSLGGVDLVPGQTYYLVLPVTATNIKWSLNSLTNTYADGKAQAKITGTWTDVNYDHWFKVARAEKAYRCSLVLYDRQPVEATAKTILQTCHGRLGWWDGLYRITLDCDTAGGLVISDLQSPTPDVPLVQDSLSCGRSDSEVPNTATGEYYDTETWTRLPIKVETSAMQQGLEQPRVLDVGFVAVPSGGQLYRLLATWLARAGRTWRASCTTMQHGMRLAPGDTAILTSKLWTGTKTVLVDDISDGPGGTFDLALVEYAAGDFSAAPYVPQADVPTITALNAAFVLYVDDFTRGGTTSGTIGEQRWTLGVGNGVVPANFRTPWCRLDRLRNHGSNQSRRYLAEVRGKVRVGDEVDLEPTRDRVRQLRPGAATCSR